jgi:hypothetical protein
MLKKYIFLFVLLSAARLVHAQDSKTVYERYVDFNLVRLEADNSAALEMGEAILDSADALPEKSRISFYNSMGKLYEVAKANDRAILFFEKVATAVPNYYVAHRALGYLYLDPANEIQTELNAAKKNTPAYTKLKAEYKAAALKAVGHLEIAQSCDPSDDTLAIIKNLYKSIGDNAAPTTLDERLKKISKDCLDILSDN